MQGVVHVQLEGQVKLLRQRNTYLREMRDALQQQEEYLLNVAHAAKYLMHKVARWDHSNELEDELNGLYTALVIAGIMEGEDNAKNNEG